MSCGLLVLFASIVAEVAGSVAIRYAHGFTRWLPSVLSLVCYGAAIWGLSYAARTIPMSVAVTLWAGLGTVGSLLAARLIFGETLAIGQWLGVAYVVVGVVLIQTFATQGAHA